MGLTITSILGIACALIAVYLAQFNRVLRRTPAAAQRHLPAKPLTREDIAKTFERVSRDGIDYASRRPQRRARRYIVVGGSGVLGGEIVVQLLQGGTPREAIRIIDVRPSTRDELKADGSETALGFVQADITSSASVDAAFSAPWPAAVSALPLTVFHSAAVIRPAERSPLLYDRCARVNVAGTANVVAAARRAGAGVLIATSSSTVAARPVPWFRWWRHGGPPGFVQVLTEEDFDRPLREAHADYPTNYMRSKAEAERLVCDADEARPGPGAASGRPAMRTAAIRPGNIVYGGRNDIVLGKILADGVAYTFSAPWVQHWTSDGNAALAHMQCEAALLGEHTSRVAGRPYLVRDKGPPLRFEDMYSVLSATSITGFVVRYPPPVVLLLVAYAVEAYVVLVNRFPWLQRFLAEPRGPVSMLQPGTFTSTVSLVLDDSLSKKAPEDSGIGYEPACTSVEGICAQVVKWNKWAIKTGLVNKKQDKTR
ncbi:hypothetical protein FDECE_7085 [Fusarium decemcellulare]|nr:hypothetical protein FDECE_7085 [Fusarium decemcellulare]